MQEVQEAPLQEVKTQDKGFEQWFENNKKNVGYVLGGVAFCILAYFGYKQFVVKPKEVEAKTMVWMAEKHFEQDSFKLALNGDGKNLGFEAIAEDYSSTETGNLAHYYAGICCLHLNDFNAAIDHLSDYNANDPMLEPLKLGALGDAYAELNDLNKALEQYKQAARIKNDFTAPIYLSKAATVLDEQKNYTEALATYQELKKSYPESEAGRNADKYIAKYEILAEK